MNKKGNLFADGAIVAAIVLGVFAGILILVITVMLILRYRQTRSKQLQFQYSEHSPVRAGSGSYSR